MEDAGLCEVVCRESGWLGELVVVLLIAARALYNEWRTRRLKAEAASLQEKVAELSIRPPANPVAIPVTLQLAPNPGAHELLGGTLSVRPSEPTKQAPNEAAPPAEAPEPPDPDWVAPREDL